VRSCRDLAQKARFGALATVARDPAGWPFATLVAIAFDAHGRPLLLLSRLAEHTKNLEASSRASLLVSAATSAPPLEGGDSPDPLAQGRMTIVGECARVREEENDATRAIFLSMHPEAAGYASFADFGMWRIEVAHVRWVGGFGRMEWVSGEEYCQLS
jgi:putative heme iron utilization protein